MAAAASTDSGTDPRISTSVTEGDASMRSGSVAAKAAVKGVGTTESKATVKAAAAAAAAVGGDEEHAHDIRIAMIGNVDSGKSTLVGCLSRSVADDGRGKARALVFRHAHEQENGRTSSVGMELMGFRDEVVVSVDTKASRQKLWRDVRARSSKAVTFLDLCGHEKYLKTTVFGLTGMLPDYGMVVVGANMGVSKMTKEHMGIAAALRLPVMVIITKIDIAPENVFVKTLKSATKTLRSIKRMPLPLRSLDQVPTAAKGMASGRVAPVICVSNVSGEGLDVLRELLRQLEPRVSGATAAAAAAAASTAARVGAAAAAGSAAAAAADEETAAGVAGSAGKAEAATAAGADADDADDAAGESKPAIEAMEAAAIAAEAARTGPGEVVIDSVFNVTGVGTVVAGTVLRGRIHAGSTMLLGPDGTGEFQPVTVRSIQCQYTAVDFATAGGSSAFAIRPKARSKLPTSTGRRAWVRKGMALVDPALRPRSVWGFEAEIYVLHHQTTLSVGYAPIMHIGVAVQSARLLEMRSKKGKDVDTLKTGDRAIVRCQFMYHPEYVTGGSTLLFREGRAKGVGKITRVFEGKVSDDWLRVGRRARHPVESAEDRGGEGDGDAKPGPTPGDAAPSPTLDAGKVAASVPGTTAPAASLSAAT